MTPTFNNTIDVLAQAYQDDAIIKGNCCACVVGNLVASALGIHVDVSPNANFAVDAATWPGEEHIPQWNDIFYSTADGEQHIFPDAYRYEAKKQVDATGYTWQQLAQLEKAFESAMPGDGPEPVFLGLLAAIDALAAIHSVSPEEATQAKQRVVHPYPF